MESWLFNRGPYFMAYEIISLITGQEKKIYVYIYIYMYTS